MLKKFFKKGEVLKNLIEYKDLYLLIFYFKKKKLDSSSAERLILNINDFIDNSFEKASEEKKTMLTDLKDLFSPYITDVLYKPKFEKIFTKSIALKEDFENIVYKHLGVKKLKDGLNSNKNQINNFLINSLKNFFSVYLQTMYKNENIFALFVRRNLKDFKCLKKRSREYSEEGSIFINSLKDFCLIFFYKLF